MTTDEKTIRPSVLKSKHGVRWINWDLCMGFAALALGFHLSPHESLGSTPPGFYIMAFFYGLILATVCRLCEIPRPGFDFHIARYDILSSGVLAVITSLLLFSFLTILLVSSLQGRYIFLFTGLLSYLLVCFPRIILTELSNRNPMKIALYGEAPMIRRFLTHVSDAEYWDVVGYLKTELLDVEDLELPLLDVVDESVVDCVVICTDENIPGSDAERVMEFPLKGVEVFTKGAFLEKYMRSINLDCTNIHWVTSFSTLSADRAAFFGKRLMDIGVSFTALVILLPFSPLVALLIKLDSRGPVFYRQDRVGLFNKNFSIVYL